MIKIMKQQKFVNMENNKALLKKGFAEFTEAVDYLSALDWFESRDIIITCNYTGDLFYGSVYCYDMDDMPMLMGTEYYNNRYDALDAAIAKAIELL